jgi:hypothetical protein
MVVMGYQSSKAADEARVAKVKAHLGGPPRGPGAWRGEERGEGGEEGGGAPMPAEFANWLKANKMAVTPAAGHRAKQDRDGAVRTT